ncbi:MAG: hypothetical protein IVW55_01150 [Chloroflexi bacterium]|nr:hypothetical protein [Chloroflexota bacterium]
MRKIMRWAIGVGVICATVVAATLIRPLDVGQVSAQAGCQVFKETGKSVCGKFLTYWQQHGGLAQQGYPISGEFTEVSDLNGQPYTVQYFERAVFEMHPENQPPYDVLLSQLGTFRFHAKYPGGEPGASNPTPVPPAPPGIGVKVPLRDGVTLALIPSTGTVSYVCIGRTLEWQFKLDNTSDTPFTANLDPGSVLWVDSTGKTYRPSACNGNFTGIFSSPTAIRGKSDDSGAVRMPIDTLPPAATFIDLHMTLTGIPVIFRYSLR